MRDKRLQVKILRAAKKKRQTLFRSSLIFRRGLGLKIKLLPTEEKDIIPASIRFLPKHYFKNELTSATNCYFHTRE